MFCAKLRKPGKSKNALGAEEEEALLMFGASPKAPKAPKTAFVSWRLVLSWAANGGSSGYKALARGLGQVAAWTWKKGSPLTIPKCDEKELP